MSKYLSSLFLALALLFASQAPAQTFAHYAGASGKPLASNGMQQVATYEYYIYVSSTAGPYVESHGGKNYVKFILPFLSWHNNGAIASGNDLEPMGYYRWYNYKTDELDDDKLVKYDFDTRSTNRLAKVSYAATDAAHAGKAAGWIAYNQPSESGGNGPAIGKEGAAYELSSDCDDASWAGADIACDVSRYCDYNDAATYTPGTLTHEPTLTTRYIYHIRSAAQLANAMRDSVVAGKENKTFEDKQITVFGAKDKNAVITLQADLPFPFSYWYHPLNNPGTKHVFATDDTYKITASDFSADLVHADRLFWRIYSPDGTKYCQFENNRVSYPSKITKTNVGTYARTFDMSISTLNAATWYNLNGTTATTKPTIAAGQNVYVVDYASNGSSYSPIGCVRIDFRSFHPMTDAQIAANAPYRAKASLEQQYTRSMQPITYDTGFDNTQSAPTSADDNMVATPSDFSTRSYGFVYRNLINKSYGGMSFGNRWKNPEHSPIHGEYGIYKSANFYTTDGSNITNISLDTHLGADYSNPTTNTSNKNSYWSNGQGYMWWLNSTSNRSSFQVFDRTHAEDPARYGGFLYVDASDEPRQMAAESFQASLCSGSQLIVTAWVNSMTATNAGVSPEPNADPQVVFSLYGVDNHNVRHRLLNISSGDFTSNAQDFVHASSQGQWYQVFGRAVLPTNSGVENYSDFLVTVNNYCKSTIGADYAIDDIEIFQRTAKLSVIQDPPACPDDDGTTSQSVTLTIKGNYETLSPTTTGANKAFYRLVKASDGSVVTGTDLYGTGADNYGTITVPTTYDADATLSDGTTKQFETESDGTISLILDSRKFSLEPNETYYVSVATPSPSDANVPGTWGTPTATCSVYSPNFTIVQQSYVLNGTSGTTTANLSVPCDATAATNYKISGLVRTTDPKNGGMVQLSTVNMDWYIGTRDELNSIDGLVQAIQDLRSVYTTGGYDQAVSGAYTDADKTLLQKYVYDATNNKAGKLILSASTSLTGYPFASGDYTVCAIPVTGTVTLSGVTYTLCPDPMEISVRARKQGVNLVFGAHNVVYPSSSSVRDIRVGLPQLREIQNATTSSLRIPIQKRIVSEKEDATAVLRFISSADATTTGTTAVILSNTNDPAFSADKGTLTFAHLTGLTANAELAATDTTLNIRLADNILSRIHEGYWYELGLMYVTTNTSDNDLVNCPGETYFRLKIVPEYLSWTPTADGGNNSNWNNDNNWERSTASELYMPTGSYTDYGTASKTDAAVDAAVTRRNAYAPMYFTKVTVPVSTLYPCMGYITYASTDNRAIHLANAKNNVAASIDGDITDISYELEAYPIATGGGYYCQNYRGNICDQLYLKPTAELRSQQFLVYNKAWTELELPVGKWYSVASPLKDTYAGDYYVPAATGRQETPAFTAITWSGSDNNRVTYPFYQRAWGDATVTEQDGGTGYSAWDSPAAMVPTDGTITSKANGWSHVYNTADAVYGSENQNDNYAFSLRVGDAYMPAADLRTTKTLVRLPKEDTSYSYQKLNSDGTTSPTTTTLTRTDNGKLRVDVDKSETAVGQITVTPSEVSPADNHYYLIANPYTSSVSVSAFITDNTSALADQHVWVLRGDTLIELPSVNANQVSTEYNVIRPQESFFVKMDATNSLVFNQGQQVDANVRTNTAEAANAKPMFVTYYYSSGSLTGIDQVLSAGDGALKTWNPSPGQLAVSYTGSDALVGLAVYTLDGRLWQTLRPSANTLFVQVPAGVYLVKGVTKKGNAKVKKQLVN